MINLAKENKITVTNQFGIPFNVRLVKKGDGYGRKNCLTHNEDDMLVEFYDARNIGGDFGNNGHFVSRYYASTLKNHDGGLWLDGGVNEWTVTKENMDEVLKFIG